MRSCSLPREGKIAAWLSAMLTEVRYEGFEPHALLALNSTRLERDLSNRQFRVQDVPSHHTTPL